MKRSGNSMSIARAAWLAAAVLAVIALAGCATAPQSPPGAAEARAKLDRLQADSDLASRAPIEIKEADAAVRLAETPVPQDEALGIYRVYLADHKVEIAAAKASTRYAEDQRVELAEAREGARLKARTLEAETARNRARLASSDAAMARDEADAARASAAVAAADAARRAELVRSETDLEKAELQRQIDLLQAKTTERGLVLTLGNVLFATGRSDLKTSGQDSLNKLVTFLNQYEDRNILIEGHTDNVGSDANNMVLSTSRADSVQAYLLQQGIGGQRISATGMGESQPAASNDTETGRQENRRVEIVILNSSGQVTALNPSGQ